MKLTVLVDDLWQDLPSIELSICTHNHGFFLDYLKVENGKYSIPFAGVLLLKWQVQEIQHHRKLCFGPNEYSIVFQYHKQDGCQIKKRMTYPEMTEIALLSVCSTYLK